MRFENYKGRKQLSHISHLISHILYLKSQIDETYYLLFCSCIADNTELL